MNCELDIQKESSYSLIFSTIVKNFDRKEVMVIGWASYLIHVQLANNQESIL